MIAKCSSLTCADKYRGYYKPVVKLNAKPRDIECPDCHSILRWHKTDREKIYTAKKRLNEKNRSYL